jgi:hypothetical protein
VAVPVFLSTIERTSLSTWLRDTPSLFGFYFVLTIHTFGLAMLVGPNAVIDLRLLGVAGDTPLGPMRKWFSIMWLGFAVNAVSGLLLLYAYPTQALTNPVFYFKISFIALAVWTLTKLRKDVFGDASLSEPAAMKRGKRLAIWSLVLWFGAISAGRLLAYTHTYLTYGHKGSQ